MKFSHSLQFNAVPEWSSKYIAYSHLKKIIYTLQREKLYANGNDINLQQNGNINSTDVDLESTPLLLKNHDIYVNIFLKELNHELFKIDKFYKSQETGLLANYHELKDDVTELEQTIFQQQQQSEYPHDSNLNNKNLSTTRHASLSGVSNDDSMNSNLALDIESLPDLINNNSITDELDPFPLNNNNFNNHLNNNNNSINSNLLNLTQTKNTLGSILFNFNDNDNESVTLSSKGKYILSLKKRLIAMFTQLFELKDFIELNFTGFQKICKKFDKSLNTSIKLDYLKLIQNETHVFNKGTLEKINNIIKETIETYCNLSNLSPSINGTMDFISAKQELSNHLRDHIVWERNTVWKDMINIERKANSVKRDDTNNSIKTNKDHMFMDNNSINMSSSNIMDNENGIEKDLTNLNELTNSLLSIIKSKKMLNFIVITFCFIVVKFWLTLFNDPLQQNCFAILIYASLLWATETLPLFVTSLLIPFLIVILPVLRDPTTALPFNSVDSSKFILSTMWSSVIMLLLGGFTLAAALSKYNIAKVLSTYILASAGTNPAIILLTNMFVALFVSMWVSNVASPVLCYSIIQPLLRTLPSQSSYSKALILGIALASNVGGMASPIASPQNIFAVGVMDPTPSWGEWFIVSIPVCVICILLIWILLLLTFPLDPNIKLLQLHPSKDPFTPIQWFVTTISIMTILLWCFSNSLSSVFGEMGIISIIPILLFFGTGLLSAEDFNNFMWTIVVLAMGGSTLGKAVSNSGLLSTIAEDIKSRIEGKSLFVIATIFGAGIITMATFVSHTVAAMILVPLMGEIGQQLPEDHSRLLIMLTAMLASAAMGLPTSGFPNVTAISMTDELGDRYLNVGNFISRGIPSSIFCYMVIITLGFGLMKLLSF